jgi:hypothetical protein
MAADSNPSYTEDRVVQQFWIKLRKNSKGMLQMLQVAYGSEAWADQQFSDVSSILKGIRMSLMKLRVG